MAFDDEGFDITVPAPQRVTIPQEWPNEAPAEAPVEAPVEEPEYV